MRHHKTTSVAWVFLSLLDIWAGYGCLRGASGAFGETTVQDGGPHGGGPSGGQSSVPVAPQAAATRSEYRSPFDIAFSPDGSELVVADATRGELVVIDVPSRSVKCAVPVDGLPRGVAWMDQGRALVAEYDAGSIAQVDTSACSVVRRFAVGPKTVGIAVLGDTLVAADYGLAQVRIINLATGLLEATLCVPAFALFVDITPDGNTAVIGHALPSGDARQPTMASSITLIDLAALQVSGEIKLPFGSSNLRQVRVAPDGKRAYAVHTLGRVTLPTTQLTKGWVNSNALSIIDMQNRQRLTTVLLNRMMEGAADPWGLAVAPDCGSLWVSVAATRQAIRVDLNRLHQLLDVGVPADMVLNGGRAPTPYNRRKYGYYDRPLSDIWFEIRADRTKLSLLQNDLGALHGAGVLTIAELGLDGPRGISMSPDGATVAVGTYFSGDVVLIDASNGRQRARISLGDEPDETLSRKGERLYHDAITTQQKWLSCATCHPGGRSDGLNWDLLNDGIGNPKNSKAHVYSHHTPPMMSHGVRDNVEIAIDAGFRFIKFALPEGDQAAAISAYMDSLGVEPSPHRTGGAVSAAAHAGRALFYGETGCSRCHSGDYLTDMKAYDVGTAHDLDSSGTFDTPTLFDLWQTAPYLHDGSAATLMEVLTSFNIGDRHGRTSHLSDAEREQLVAFLLELDARPAR